MWCVHNATLWVVKTMHAVVPVLPKYYASAPGPRVHQRLVSRAVRLHLRSQAEARKRAGVRLPLCAAGPEPPLGLARRRAIVQGGAA